MIGLWNQKHRVRRLLTALVLAAFAGPALAQPDIAGELETLKGAFVSMTVKSLPPGLTGGMTGLSLVLLLNSPLGAETEDLSPEQQSASMSLCRKVGVPAIAQYRPKPELGDLRFFVVELKATLASLGSLRAVAVKGLVFDTDNDCVELP